MDFKNDKDFKNDGKDFKNDKKLSKNRPRPRG